MGTAEDGSQVQLTVTLREYQAAVVDAHAFIARRAGSSDAEAMANLLAAIEEPLNPISVVGCLVLLDAAAQQTALALLVGRCMCGRQATEVDIGSHLLVRTETDLCPGSTSLRPRR